MRKAIASLFGLTVAALGDQANVKDLSPGRRIGANVDNGQTPGCKHGLSSGGTARRRAQYKRAEQRAKHKTIRMQRQVRVILNQTASGGGRITGEGKYGPNDGR